MEEEAARSMLRRSGDDGGGGRGCWCRSEAAVTSDEEIDGRRGFRKAPTRLGSVPTCSFLSGDEVAFTREGFGGGGALDDDEQCSGGGGAVMLIVGDGG